MKRLFSSSIANKVGRNIIFGACLLFLYNANAENKSLSSLWKEFSVAERKDNPKTAVGILHSIQHTAEQQKAYGDLLYAMLKECNVQMEISPDSAQAAKNRFLARQKAWDGTNGVIATICQTTLFMEQGAPRLDSLIASKDAGEYLKKNGTAVYKPLIEQQIDSRYFDDNLLSVIALHTNQERALYDYYASAGNRRAACIAAALWMEKEGTLQQTDSLVAIYQDLPECGALAVRKCDKMHSETVEARIKWIDEALGKWSGWKEINQLRNVRNRLTNPRFSAYINGSSVTTDTDVMLYLNEVCNIKGLRVTLKRENKSARGGYDLVRNYDKAVSLNSDYEVVKDSLSLGRLPLGIWLMTITDTEGKVKKSEEKLYVSDLMVINLPLPADKKRFVVVNAVTGQPVPAATLHIQQQSQIKKIVQVQTDDKGEYIYSSSYKIGTVFATKGDDKAMQPARMDNNYYISKYQARKICNIYTDRAIYRPGQNVNAAFVCYEVYEGKELKAIENDTLTVVLRNSQNKEVAKKQIVTDKFGAASVDFQLPVDGRNGQWSIVTENGRESIRVEEYKRPTFEVTMETPEIPYSSGDTVIVKGTARTYSGVPVAGAKVAYSVQRKAQWWWMNAENSRGMLFNDTIVTAPDGTFYIKMPMEMPSGVNVFIPRFYTIDATASVTDNAGESHSAVISLPLSNREAYLSCNMPKEILADSSINVTVSRRNAAGKETVGTVIILLDGVKQGEVEANKPYTLAQNIPSGRHEFMAVCDGDTVRHTFVAFRKSDERPMIDTRQWCYQSDNVFPEDGNGVWVQVGSSDKDVHIVYSVFAGDTIIAHGEKDISNENVTRTLYYKDEYGDGVTIALAWVKDGKMYERTMFIKRPLPSTKLNMEWTTFRDRLVPGQKEQWEVRITNPDGSPANARMVAVLYDKSLEQLQQHHWNFADMRILNLPYACWRTPYRHVVTLRGSHEWKNLEGKVLKFSGFATDAVPGYYPIMPLSMEGTISRGGIRKMRMQGMSAMSAKQNLYAKVDNDGVESGSIGTWDVVTATDDTAVNEQEDGVNMSDEVEDIQSRSDFAETAFFLPAVMTDAEGGAAVKFTLPESVTTWRFMALAHDVEMRNATLIADAVAQKPLMVQPNMPRFLREGDDAMVAANVANLSDKSLNVVVTMTVLDAVTERKVQTATKKITVKENETGTVAFPIDAAKLVEGTYICRFTAKGGTHTDGEQRLLVILPNKETVTVTTAYTFVEPTDTVLSFAEMIPEEVQKAHLKVDYVDNPAWLMIEALPEMAEAKSKNAISLSAALYANRVTAKLKNIEDSSDDILAALQCLQNKDGSFSWWEGMQGSTYMTTEVVKTLARLNKLCGKQSDTQTLLNNAFRFLRKEMDDEVLRMKHLESKGTVSITSTQLDWLYALTLEGRNGGASAAYILSHVAKDMQHSDMAGKAVAAIVLYGYGKKSDAREYVESIKQHTVYRKDVGRYFDSYRTAYSWCDYRIPTQTLAIEALRTVTPQDGNTINEMCRWLLSSKRTQEWRNPINAVNAVHAFFADGMGVLEYEKNNKVIADKQITPKNASIAVRKDSKCESWVAAYVTYKQKTENITAAATGLSVKREVLVNGVPADNGHFDVGDKITVRITVTADRDYDFVSVTDNRPACIEPVTATSAYIGSCYQEVKDTSTAYHFNKMPKGMHVIQSDYYVDRAGYYTSGTVTAECTYANEFRGIGSSYNIVIEK